MKLEKEKLDAQTYKMILEDTICNEYKRVVFVRDELAEYLIDVTGYCIMDY